MPKKEKTSIETFMIRDTGVLVATLHIAFTFKHHNRKFTPGFFSILLRSERVLGKLPKLVLLMISVKCMHGCLYESFGEHFTQLFRVRNCLYFLMLKPYFNTLENIKKKNIPCKH